MFTGRISRPSLAPALAVGDVIGEYELQGQIGEGAMGTVYAGIQPLIGKRVAIKVLKPELCADQGQIDRFVQEAQAINQIGHPNIVDVFSLGELPDGRAYFVMEWLRGEDLKARLARGPLAVAETCAILDGIARALDAAHAKGIVHRDLKPENVFLHEIDAGPPMVKLLDFGIAKLLHTSVKEKTQTGSMLGTPRYMSPEQARGVAVDHRSDIYSLGVMAYEMLCGQGPFDGETAMDLVVAHLNTPPPPLANRARLPRGLEQAVMRMLAKEPAQRPTLDAVRAVLADPAAAPRTRGRGMWIGVAAVGVLAAAVATWQLTRTTPAAAPPVVVTAPVITAPPPPPPPAPAAAVVAAPARSKLVIDVDGATNAEILVDGERWARGSSAMGETTAGPHAIEVIAGRDHARQDVVVVAGQPTSVRIAVKRAAPPVHRTPVAQPPTSDDDLILTPKKKP